MATKLSTIRLEGSVSLDTAISDHSVKTGEVHGVPAGQQVEWQSSAQAKADTAETNAKNQIHEVTVSNNAPSGGSNGDLWFVR